MLGGDVANEFKNNDGLADACAAVRADLPTTCERGDQVNDLEAGFQHLCAGLLLIKRGRLAVDGPRLLGGHVSESVQRLAKHVEEAP